MTVVLLEPHHDDAVLFACYTLLREQPLVVTVLSDARAQEPQVSAGERRAEAMRAWRTLEMEQASWWQDWAYRDDQTVNKPEVAQTMRVILAERENPDVVWAPLPEPGGHEHHNAIGEVAVDVFGVDRVRFYATYRRGGGRTETPTEVQPEPGWRALKLRAMSCYASQIDLPATRPWFAAEDMLREWVA